MKQEYCPSRISGAEPLNDIINKAAIPLGFITDLEIYGPGSAI